MITIQDIPKLRKQVMDWRIAGDNIGFVPTMGALHDGHLALVEAAQKACKQVIVSIFVNPLQFSFGEDFGRYPRQMATDSALLKDAGVDVLYTPKVEDVYPDGFSTQVIVAQNITERLCGMHRKGHFDGVTAVVSKLFNQVLPDKAFFGEKDYQQFLVLEKMVLDLNYPIEMISIPTVREPDGLALSSRNQYLSESERVTAVALHQTLKWVKRFLRDATPPEYPAICEQAVQKLLHIGFEKVDYIQVLHVPSLSAIHDRAHLPEARIFGAAHLGAARLIDNIPAG